MSIFNLKEAEERLSYIRELVNEIPKLENEINQYKIENKMYHPMSDLCSLKEHEILSISLIYIDDNDKPSVLKLEGGYYGTSIGVDESGTFYCNSDKYGIIVLDSETGNYVWYHFYKRISPRLIGYLDVQSCSYYDEEEEVD